MRTRFLSLALLVAINFLNYTDRNALTSVLTDLQAYYDVDNTTASLFNVRFRDGCCIVYVCGRV